MKPETIKAIFTNLLFVIGVLLTIVGFIHGTRTVTRLIVFPEYPLDSWEETKCEQMAYPMPAVDPGLNMKGSTIPTPDTQNLKKNCEEQLEQERRVKKVEDIVASVSLLVSGIVLVVSFRKFILK